MKYLFQQMIAFWSIILTILIVVGISFTQFTKKTMMENTYKQMNGYAQTVVQEKSTYEELLGNIQVTETVLERQNVRFFYIDSDLTIDYPPSLRGEQGQNIINDENWQKAKKGSVVQTTLKVKLDGKDTRVAMVIQPLFLLGQTDLFSGVIVVLQPISNVEESMAALTENLFKGFLISSVIALLFSYVIAQFQVNRINRMKKATRQISEGNFDVNLEIKSNDELDELAHDFNLMADALKESHEEIERQEDRRRQFMADAAHEMRTPLTTINGLLEGLEYGAIPENQQEKCIHLMQNETRRLIRLVNENLDYEKIRTNQISMVIQKFNATETLQSIVQQLEAKAAAAGNTLTLGTQEEIDVYADYDRFVQIIVNIVQNAIQFTTDGSIVLTVEKGYLETVVKISDTGIGMTDEEIQNVWDRYYKADPSRKNTKYGESGLGLAIVQQLIKLHKGKIEIDSEKDKGTTFIITLPDAPVTEEIVEQ